MDATNRIYCYIFVGGKLVQKNDGLWEYVGGKSKGIHIYKGMTFEEFTHKVLEKFNISLHMRRMHYTLKFNPRVIQDLEDKDDLDNVVSHSDDFANVYIVESPLCGSHWGKYTEYTIGIWVMRFHLDVYLKISEYQFLRIM